MTDNNQPEQSKPILFIPETQELPQNPLEIPQTQELSQNPLEIPKTQELSQNPLEIPQTQELPQNPLGIPQTQELSQNPLEIPQTQQLPESALEAAATPLEQSITSGASAAIDPTAESSNSSEKFNTLRGDVLIPEKIKKSGKLSSFQIINGRIQGVILIILIPIIAIGLPIKLWQMVNGWLNPPPPLAPAPAATTVPKK